MIKQEIHLYENNATGYRWITEQRYIDIIAHGEVKITQEIRRKLNPQYDPEMVGGGHITTFILEGERFGEIMFTYRQPWDKGEIAEQFIITLTSDLRWA